MKLSSPAFQAFGLVAQHRSFSRAAIELRLTQSAVSQRVAQLEADLESPLFLRKNEGLELTEFGDQLFCYWLQQKSMEEELFNSQNSEPSEGLRGHLRVLGFSSILRSLVIPRVAGVTKKNPRLSFEFYTDELYRVPDRLMRGEVDFAFCSQKIARNKIEQVFVGEEKNVLTHPIKNSPEIFLDHDPKDTTTFNFFQLQSKKPKIIQRSFMGEIYSIIDGVEQGLGSAVLPEHLVSQNKKIRIAKGYKALKVPVYLCYRKQSYYTDLQKLLIATLAKPLFS